MYGVKLTPNDVETLRAVEITLRSGEYERYVPHDRARRLGIYRLANRGLVTDLGPCACRDCDDPRHWDNEVPSSYVLTEEGKQILHSWNLAIISEES